MDELIKVLQPFIGTGLASAIIVGALYYGSKFIKPSVVQADANAALYTQLMRTIEGLDRENKMLRRQQVILERLAMKAGIDVEQAYKDAGIYDEDDKK